MSGVGPVSGADVKTHKLQTQAVNLEKPEASKEPEDKVEIGKKSISKPRKVVEKVIGSPVGLVTMAGKAVGGIFGGGVSGVTGEKRDAAGPLGLTSGAAYVGLGIGAGLMLAGGWIPAVVGGVAGLGLTLLSGVSGSMEEVGDKVGQKAAKATSDNQPSDSKVRDTVMNFTEGGIVGGIFGGVEGLKQGTDYGAGIVSGVIEGTKGMVGSLAGTYEKKAEAPEKTPENTQEQPKDQKSFLRRAAGAVARVPRNVTRFLAGSVTGAVGGALGVIDGLAQGVVLGSEKETQASSNAHNLIKGLQIVAGGALAGAAVAGGGWMIAAGAGVGVIAAGLLNAISAGTGADEKFADGLTDAVRHAQKDNVYKNEPDQYGDRKTTVYETFRDGIEGALTGAGAGVREGVREGYHQGSGVVDGVFDAGKAVIKGTYNAGKGIAKGVVGGISGAIKKPPKEEVSEEPGQPGEVQKPEDEKQEKAKKNFVQKLIQVPGKVLKGVVGVALGAATAPLHIIPGAVKGLGEGVNKSYRGRMGSFHTAMFLQNVGTAATAGFLLGGPVTAALAGGGALAFTGLTTYIGEKTGVYDELAKQTEEKIEHALSDNKGNATSVAFQDATEGTIIGAAVAGGKGFSVGYDSGKSIVSGAADVVEGSLEGLYEVGKNIVNKAIGK